MFTWLKNAWQDWGRSRSARRAAELSSDTAQNLIERKLGPAPSRATYEYRKMAAGQDAVHRAEERQQDLWRAQSAAEAAGRPELFALWTAALVVVELAGILGLLRTLDVPPEIRPLAGFGVLLGVIGLTAILATLVARVRGTVGLARAGWVIVTSGAILLYLVGVAAFVLVRIAEASSDAPLFLTIAEAIFFASMAIAPAWWLKATFASFLRARTARRELRLVRREVRKLEKEARRADRGLRSFEEREARYAAAAARIRAELATKRRTFEAVRDANDQ